jgi:signal transduction histidine kinase
LIVADGTTNVLLVDDDEDVFFLVKDLLSDVEDGNLEVRWCPRYEDVKPTLTSDKVDACLIDHYLGAHTGLELVNELVSAKVKIPLILVTGRGDRMIDLAAMKAGAADYLTKDELTGTLLDRAIRFSIQRYREAESRAELERRLLQSQKLEAIGQLAAGVAHEINTPIQYIGSNLQYLLHKLPQVFETLEAMPPKDAEKVLGLRSNIQRALEDSDEGIRRISEIVKAIQDFAHPGSATEKKPCNLHEIIDATLRLVKNEWKYVATVTTEFSPEVSQVPLIKGRFEQALLNLLVNAAHAIEDRLKAGIREPGAISIRTARLDDGNIEIRISDNGCGIPKEIAGKIFDLFFTTKEAGRGTGQGLALVHSVICQSHLGSVRVESEVGRGSTFIIVLPSSDEGV